LCLLVMLPRPPLPPLFPYTRSSDLEPRMLVVVLQEGALVKHAQFVYAGGDHIRVFLPTTAPLDSSREPLECPYVYPTDACVNGQPALLTLHGVFTEELTKTMESRRHREGRVRIVRIGPQRRRDPVLAHTAAAGSD